MARVIEIRPAPVPFSAARGFVSTVVDAALPDSVERALRPVTHTADPGAVASSARQNLKTQLRFHTRERGLRGLRIVGWMLAERHDDGIELQVLGNLHRSDLDFFSTLAQWLPLRTIWDQSNTGPAAALDVEDERVARDRDSVTGGGDTARILGRYLGLGDPWTAGWLADALLATDQPVGGAAAEMAALAFMLEGRTMDAEHLYRMASDTGPLDRARVKYGLAMLYARHHPPALRDKRVAASLISEAWAELETVPPSSDVLLEQALNRNALALLLYRDNRYDAAAEILDTAIESMSDSGEDLALSILYNNLGRVRAAMDDQAAAEQALRTATELDPQFGEYWLDLGNFHARGERWAPALAAAGRAAALAPDLAEAPALLGYVHALTGDHQEAARQYGTAATNQPDQQEYLLGAARESCECDDYQQAGEWLRRLRIAELSPDQRAEAELLELETDSHLRQPPLSQAEIVQRLRELAGKYPESELVRENLEFVGTT